MGSPGSRTETTMVTKVLAIAVSLLALTSAAPHPRQGRTIGLVPGLAVFGTGYLVGKALSPATTSTTHPPPSQPSLPGPPTPVYVRRRPVSDWYPVPSFPTSTIVRAPTIKDSYGAPAPTIEDSYGAPAARLI